MSESTISPNKSHSAGVRRPRVPRTVKIGHRPMLGLLVLFLLVFGAQFAFGMWMNSRGFLWHDALSRASSALFSLYSVDPRLVAVGFVWMPLPSLLELIPTAFYPLWPNVVTSGFASTVTTAMAGGATAALLLAVARRLGLSSRLGWAYALIVSANPMLFLYASNGLSEGVAAPFLTGAVCFLTLFWRTGLRRYVTASGLALALGFASLYEGAPYGAALFAALVLGLLWSSESKESAPQGRLRAVEGLGIILLLPSFYVAALWMGVNGVIMGDPLYFHHSPYSNYGQTVAMGSAGLGGEEGTGKPLGTLQYVVERSVPFLIPAGFLLLVRALDGRLWKVNTLGLVLLLVSVPFGLIAPLLYLGASFGWLRLFIYPLFVAAGWGLYEVASSKHPRWAVGLIFAGWIVAAPVSLWAMSEPELGQEEHYVVQSLLTGQSAQQVGFENRLEVSAPVAHHLKVDVMPDSQAVVATDAFHGWSIAAQMPPEYLKRLVMIADRDSNATIRHLKKHDVSYLLVPNPEEVPQDALVRVYPRLWIGEQRGFELVKSFTQTPQFRLYRIVTPGTGELKRNDAQLRVTQNQIGEAEYVGKVGEIQAQSVEAVIDSDDKLLRYDALTADDVEELEANRVTLQDLTDRVDDLDPPQKYRKQYEVFGSAIDELYEATELAHRLVADPTSASQADFDEYRSHVDRAAAHLQRSNEILSRDYEAIEGTRLESGL